LKAVMDLRKLLEDNVAVFRRNTYSAVLNNKRY
jgi:hypothetical protein